jgi:hypothetical protein
VTLHERVLAAFDRADDRLGDAPGLGPVREDFAEERQRFLTTLRVVLVGRISSGKSTLANALLGGYRVATGPEELTYNVNWLRYATQPRLEVHFRDGRPTEQRQLTELEQITARAREDSRLHDYLRQIDFIEVFDPNPQLRDFDLVDTPGLDSHFAEDSANTLRFLGRGDDEVRQTSVAAAGKADALVLVFARGLASSEGELLADFNGPGFGAANPIAAIGALTKVETYWPAHPDPWAEARRVAGQTMAAGGGRRLLYELRPVASLVAAGAATLTEPELADLTELARMEPAVLAKFAGMGPAFSREHSDLPLPAERRRALRGRFSGYGVVLACGLLRDGVTGLAGLRAELIRQSGISDFRGLLVNHFGHRADLIKLQRVMAGLRRLPREAGPRLAPLELRRVDYAVAEVTQLEVKEHALRELAVLRRYYDGALKLDEAQSADLLRVSGEHGTSAAARLGLPADASAEQQADGARALLDRWAAFTADPSHESATRQAGYVMRRSAERLLTQIAVAGRAAARTTEKA